MSRSQGLVKGVSCHFLQVAVLSVSYRVIIPHRQRGRSAFAPRVLRLIA